MGNPAMDELLARLQNFARDITYEMVWGPVRLSVGWFLGRENQRKSMLVTPNNPVRRTVVDWMRKVVLILI
jgi:hypothetical protein